MASIHGCKIGSKCFSYSTLHHHLDIRNHSSYNPSIMDQFNREQEKTCGNCHFFKIQENGIPAVDVKTGEQIKLGKRNCRADNTAWADCPCPTGEFTPKP